MFSLRNKNITCDKTLTCIICLSVIAAIDLLSGAFVIICTESLECFIAPVCPPLFIMSVILLFSRLLLGYIGATFISNCLKCKTNRNMTVKSFICIVLSVTASCLFFRLRLCILPLILTAFVLFCIVSMLFSFPRKNLLFVFSLISAGIHIYFFAVILLTIII